jgi:hypothetical protein
MGLTEERILELVKQGLREVLEESFISSESSDNQDDFEIFWKIYPRKAGKAEARKVWIKIKPSAALTLQIISALKNQKARLWSRVEPKFIPHASRWLRGKRWLDEIPDCDNHLLGAPRKPTTEELELLRNNK